MDPVRGSRPQHTAPVNQRSMGKSSDSTKSLASDVFELTIGPNSSRKPADHEYNFGDSGKNYSRFFN